jgi:hypothetical protein
MIAAVDFTGEVTNCCCCHSKTKGSRTGGRYDFKRPTPVVGVASLSTELTAGVRVVVAMVAVMVVTVELAGASSGPTAEEGFLVTETAGMAAEEESKEGRTSPCATRIRGGT